MLGCGLRDQPQLDAGAGWLKGDETMIHNRNEMDLTDGQEWMNDVLIHARNIHTGKEFAIVKIDYPDSVEVYVLDNGDRWNANEFWKHHETIVHSKDGEV